MRIWRPGPIASITFGPVIGHRTIQQFDKASRDLTASVPAIVDDQRFLGCLAIELAEQIVLPRHTSVNDVDVTDFSVSTFINVLAVLFDPAAESQVVVAAEQFHGDPFVFVIQSRVFADGQRDGHVRHAGKRSVRVLVCL